MKGADEAAPAMQPLTAHAHAHTQLSIHHPPILLIHLRSVYTHTRATTVTRT